VAGFQNANPSDFAAFTLVPSHIPKWYHYGMSTQIAIRLPDDMVAFIDELVRSGDAGSRAAVVSRALERERRRKVAERDAAILSRQQPDLDLDQLAEFAAAVPLEDLD
jgi:Arc/MetJ-type ribon-helix-helix transcriptional regulator